MLGGIPTMLDSILSFLAILYPPVLITATGLLTLSALAMWSRSKDVYAKWICELRSLGAITEDELLRPWVSNAFFRVYTLRLAAYILGFGSVFFLCLLVPLTYPLNFALVTIAGALVSLACIRLLLAPSFTLKTEYKELRSLFPDSMPRIEQFEKIPHTPWHKKEKTEK
jgi:hypothetical protein